VAHSPDTSHYVDLTIYDKDPQEIFDDSVAALQAELPEWVPRESNVEVLLLEALSLEVAEGVFAINRLPGAIVEVLLRLFGIERSIGTPPTVTLRFTMVGTTGYTIATGTQARVTLPGAADPVIFATDTELVIAPGSSFGDVAATGDRYTSEANGIAANTTLDLMDSLLYVEHVKTQDTIVGGTDPDDDHSYFTRAIDRFSRLSDALVLPSHFTIAALEHSFVFRATSIDNWDGVSGTPGLDGGHITVAVYGDGAVLSAPQKTELLTNLEESALANLVVHLVDPTINTQAVTTTVKALQGFDITEIQTAIEDAINGYLSPMTWEWGTTLRLFELTTLINNVEGVDYIVTQTTPNADVVLTGVAPLVDAGTLTITVQPA
jgi:uncharacterized phage protein gp47/JayE